MKGESFPCLLVEWCIIEICNIKCDFVCIPHLWIHERFYLIGHEPGCRAFIFGKSSRPCGQWSIKNRIRCFFVTLTCSKPLWVVIPLRQTLLIRESICPTHHAFSTPIPSPATATAEPRCAVNLWTVDLSHSCERTERHIPPQRLYRKWKIQTVAPQLNVHQIFQFRIDLYGNQRLLNDVNAPVSLRCLLSAAVSRECCLCDVDGWTSGTFESAVFSTSNMIHEDPFSRKG